MSIKKLLLLIPMFMMFVGLYYTPSDVYAYIPKDVVVADETAGVKAPPKVTSSDDDAIKVTVSGQTVSLSKQTAGKSFDEDGSTSKLFSELFERGKLVINVIAGLASLTFILLFIKQFIKLGASAANPQARASALTGLLWIGLAVMLSGSLTMFLALSFNAFK